jgi:hypothetical protein
VRVATATVEHVGEEEDGAAEVHTGKAAIAGAGRWRVDVPQRGSGGGAEGRGGSEPG